MLQAAWSEAIAYSNLELLAVATALVYILLAAWGSRGCWVAAFISSCIYVVVLWNARLLMDSALNVYYAVMAVYGWMVWSNKQSQSSAGSGIESWQINQHLIALASTLALSLLSGALLQRYTDAAFPYLDSLTTWGSLLATWMLARKIIDTWLYWLCLDNLAIYLYINKELQFTVGLFVIYVLMSAFAWYHWRKMQLPVTEATAT